VLVKFQKQISRHRSIVLARLAFCEIYFRIHITQIIIGGIFMQTYASCDFEVKNHVFLQFYL